MIALTDPDATIVAAVIMVVGMVTAAFITCHLSVKGKQKGFEKLVTELRLHKTTWKGEYWDPEGDKHDGIVEFKQFGSRVVGEAREDGRKWLIEGLASKGRLCYVYVDVDQGTNRLSLGTSILEMDSSGKKMVGRWMGWSPDGERFDPSKLVLTLQDN